MLPILIVFGDRTAEEVLEAAQLAYRDKYDKIEKIYFEEHAFRNEHLPKLTVRGKEIHFIVGMVEQRLKGTITAACLQAGWKLVSVVHPAAVISPSAKIGAGTFIGPLATLSSNVVVGDQSIIHIQSTVGHDSRVGDFCTVLPGARISGNVILGDRVLIGSNAFLAAGIQIGDDCQVDALSYVRDDLAEGYILSPRARTPVKRIDLRADP